MHTDARRCCVTLALPVGGYGYKKIYKLFGVPVCRAVYTGPSASIGACPRAKTRGCICGKILASLREAPQPPPGDLNYSEIEISLVECSNCSPRSACPNQLGWPPSRRPEHSRSKARKQVIHRVSRSAHRVPPRSMIKYYESRKRHTVARRSKFYLVRLCVHLV